MRSRSQRRIGIARPLLAAVLPMALSAPAAAHSVPGGSRYYAASHGRNAVGSAYGESAGETPWQRRDLPSENRGGPPSYGGRPKWLPGATGVLGILPVLGGGNSSPSSWPSWEQVPARRESAPSAPGYSAYPGSAPPQTQASRPWGDPGPSGPNWQTQPGPEPSGEPVVTSPNSSTSSSARTSHPPSSHPPTGKVAGRSQPMIYPRRKPPVPPPQLIEPPVNPQPAVVVAAVAADIPPAPPSAAASPPPEPPPPATTALANPPSPPPLAPTQATSVQSPARPVWSVAPIGLQVGAVVALALCVFPLRPLTKVWRRRSRQRVARVVLVGDRGASRMIPEQAGTGFPAITLHLSTTSPVATAHWTTA
jgi:hypothetical protein